MDDAEGSLPCPVAGSRPHVLFILHLASVRPYVPQALAGFSTSLRLKCGPVDTRCFVFGMKAVVVAASR